MNSFECYYHAVEKALQKNGIATSNLSFDGFRDDCVCVEYDGLLWHVYNVDRGKKFDEENHTNPIDACKNIIYKMTDSPQQEEAVLKTFEQEMWTKTNRKIVPIRETVAATASSGRSGKR